MALSIIDSPSKPLTASATSLRELMLLTRSVSKKKYVDRSSGRMLLITFSTCVALTDSV